MRKLLILSLAIASILNVLNAQDTSVNDSLPPIDMQRQMFIYSLAKKYNDPLLAKNALYNILAQNPGNTTVMDSLAVLYYQGQNYVPAALISQDILKLNPNDLLATEIGAYSFENLGVYAKAIPLYEKMYLSNNNIELLYQIAFLQMNAKRYEEATLNIETLLADPQVEKRPLLFSLKDGRNQQVPMNAAVYRLKGMLEEDRGNTSEAKAAYEKALEITPTFESVKELLSELE